MNDLNKLGEKLDDALARLKETSQGRLFRVGTKVLYKGKLGIVSVLNKWATDPGGHTINLSLEDGTEVNDVPIDSPSLEYFRA